MIKKYINIALIILGIVLGFYGSNQNPKNEVLLTLAIVLIMIGVYRVSKTIPSKNNTDEDRS